MKIVFNRCRLGVIPRAYCTVRRRREMETPTEDHFKKQSNLALRLEHLLCRASRAVGSLVGALS